MEVSSNTLENCSYGIQWVPPKQPITYGDPPSSTPSTWPWPSIVVTQPKPEPIVVGTITIERPSLTDDEVDRIAERVAEKIAERKQAKKKGARA